MLKPLCQGDATQLAHAVQQVTTMCPPLVAACRGLASKLSRAPRQVEVLDTTKTILESALQLVFAARESGGNAKATATHQALVDAHSNTKVMRGLGWGWGSVVCGTKACQGHVDG